MKPKYKTYAELAAAFKSGELGRGYFLMLDKGGCENSLSFHDPLLSDEDNEREDEKCRDLFDGDGVRIETAFTALGIPWGWC